MSLFEELKRRRVIRLIAAYILVAWAIIQVVDVIKDPLNLPEWFHTVVIVFLGLGFPIAVIMSWIYDVTPDGITREDGTRVASTGVDYGKIALGAVLVLGAFLAGNYLTTISGTNETDFRIGRSDTVQRFVIPVDGSWAGGRERQAESALTPDGQSIVALGWFDGKATLMSRDLGDLGFTPIAGTENARREFSISPDGRRVVFIDDAAASMKTVPLAGGAALTIADVREKDGLVRLLTWGAAGNIVFSYYGDPALYIVPETGGTPRVFANPPENTAYKHARFVPKSDILTLTIGGLGFAPRHGDRLAFMQSDGEVVQTDIEGASPVAVSDEMLVFFRNDSLLATTFDIDTFSISPDVASLGSDILYFNKAYFDASRNGSVIYQTDWRRTPNAIVRIDRSGIRESLDIEPGSYHTPRLSPDDERIAVIMRTGYGDDVHILSANGRHLFQLTHGVSQAVNPIWTADSSGLYFSQDVFEQVYFTEAHRNATPEKLADLPYKALPVSLSPNGSDLFIESRRDGSANPNLAVIDTATQSARFLLEADYADSAPAVSPDGRWLAYQSRRSGIREVRVRTLGGGENDDRQVSANGGRRPTWGDDSSELFYWTEDRSHIMRVQLQLEPGVRSSEPQIMFEVADMDGTDAGYYHAPSRSFLFTTNPSTENELRRELIFIQNWPALLNDASATP